MARRELTVLISANYTTDSHRVTLPLALARVLLVGAGLAALLVAAALVLLLSGALRLARLGYLEKRNRTLEAEFAKVVVLRQRLARLEENSRAMAEMLGVDLTPPPVDWDSVTGDSSRLPDWVRAQVWGSHPVPAVVPVEGAVVSRRTDANHPGIDLVAPAGVLVRAAADGVVRERAEDREYGRYLLLAHSDGYVTFYGHLSEWTVRKGDTVLAGQAIGQVGSTGNSTAPHLHFEIRRGGRALDPATVMHF